MKTIFCRESKITKNKAYCLQLTTAKPNYFGFLKMSFNLLYNDYFFKLRFSFFGDVFDLNTYWNRKVDHAGFIFMITIFGCCFHFNIYDYRHWNYEKNCWMVY